MTAKFVNTRRLGQVIRIRKLRRRACQRQRVDFRRTALFERACTGRKRGACGHHIVHQNNLTAQNLPGFRHRKCSAHVFHALLKFQARLGLRCASTNQQASLNLCRSAAPLLAKLSVQALCQKPCLVESTFPFARMEQRDRHNQVRIPIARRVKCFPGMSEEATESSAQAFTAVKFQFENKMSQRAAVNPIAACEIESRFVDAAHAAKDFRRVGRPLRDNRQATTCTGNALPRLDAQPAIGAYTEAVGTCYFTIAYDAAGRENNRKQAVGKFAKDRLAT